MSLGLSTFYLVLFLWHIFCETFYEVLFISHLLCINYSTESTVVLMYNYFMILYDTFGLVLKSVMTLCS